MKTNKKLLLEDYGPGTILKKKYGDQPILIMFLTPPVKKANNYRCCLAMNENGETFEQEWYDTSHMNNLNESYFEIVLSNPHNHP